MRTKFTVPTAFLAVCLGFAGAHAEDSRPILRGTAGIVSVPFTATNVTTLRIACSVSLAHWYAAELGQAEPGEVVEAKLWLDPASGETYLLNASEDRMPIETLWCGIAGRSWETRSVVPLSREAGSAPAAITLSCSQAGDRLQCR